MAINRCRAIGGLLATGAAASVAVPDASDAAVRSVKPSCGRCAFFQDGQSYVDVQPDGTVTKKFTSLDNVASVRDAEILLGRPSAGVCRVYPEPRWVSGEHDWCGQFVDDTK